MAVSWRQQILAAVKTAQQQCDPSAVVAAQVWDFVGSRPLFVLAAGKAALSMARGVTQHVPVVAGLVITPGNAGELVPNVEVIRASHPFPDERSVAAAQRALAFVRAVPAQGVLLALISGGTSALLVAPIPGVSLSAKVQAIKALMAAGATITEINIVRAALSLIKAGGLVRECAAPVVTWAMSDVPGDDIGIIGSGPTVGDWLKLGSAMPMHPAGCAAALQVAQRYGVDVPGQGEPRPLRILAEIRHRDCARLLAPRSAFADVLALELKTQQPVRRLSLDADSGAVARSIATAFAELAPGQWLIAHGEPTVLVPHDAGPGGRMRDVALRLAIELAGRPVVGLALASDGCDGVCPTHPIAGAWFDGTTAARGEALGLKLAQHRDSAASAEVFAALGDEYCTGLTGQNYADVIVLQQLAS